MNKLHTVCLFLLLITMYSCSKSSSSPSIVGKWAFANITGITANSFSGTATTTTYSYSNGVLTESTSPGTTTTYKITTELWTINTDGTYNISENYGNDILKCTKIT